MARHQLQPPKTARFLVFSSDQNAHYEHHNNKNASKRMPPCMRTIGVTMAICRSYLAVSGLASWLLLLAIPLTTAVDPADAKFPNCKQPKGDHSIKEKDGYVPGLYVVSSNLPGATVKDDGGFPQCPAHITFDIAGRCLFRAYPSARLSREVQPEYC